MRRGGARIGAGRPALRGRVEHCAHLRLRDLAPGGALGRDSGTATWNSAPGCVAYERDGRFLRLTFGTGGKATIQRVQIDCETAGFGGLREWLVCGGCGSRRLALVFRNGWFGCRTCQRLAYESQFSDPLQRTWLRQRGLERKLGPGGTRLRYQRHEDYARIHAGIEQCKTMRIDLAVGAAQRLLRTFESQLHMPKCTHT